MAALNSHTTVGRADEQRAHLLQQAQEDAGKECAGDRTQTEHEHRNDGKGHIGVHTKVGIQNIGDVHAHHQHFTMAEVDNVHNAKDDVLSHTHQGVETAQQDPVDQCLQKYFH